MYSSIEMPRAVYDTEEHKMVREALSQFLKKEGVPEYEKWEKQKFVSKEFWKKMGEQGFLCMDMPEEYGGSGFDFTFSALVIEETRKAGIDFGLIVHSDIVAPYILNYGTDEQKNHYLPKMVTAELIGSKERSKSPNIGLCKGKPFHKTKVCPALPPRKEEVDKLPNP